MSLPEAMLEPVPFVAYAPPHWAVIGAPRGVL